MAISSSATSTISLLNFDSSTNLYPSKISSSTTLLIPRRLRQHPSKTGRIALLPQRRIFPRVEATKQTFSSFEDMLANSDKPVLVDFYATWCGPCQFMVPVLDQVSATLKEKIQVVKIDTEKYPKIANEYCIQALPTLIIFRDGKPCDRVEGALTADQLIERINSVLNDKQ